MDNILFTSYIIEERSYVSFVKREIHNLVVPHFGATRVAEIDIVVSEITSNLIKYAQKGELLYRLSIQDHEPVFEMICIDNGSGIKDLNHSTKDGISSTNTLGQGIGSIHRLSNLAQFYTLPEWCTVVYTVFYEDQHYLAPKKKFLSRILNVSCPGEKVSGDGAYIREFQDKTLVLVGDGLGHGPLAKEAVDRAITTFKESDTYDPSQLIRELHRGVKHTRGLVAMMALLDHQKKEWQLCGVGNIAAKLQKGIESRSYIGNNGVVGMNIPGRLENYTYELEKLQLMIFCSDGIKTRWDLIKYPGILRCDPMVLAAVLYKDQSRKTDDMTIVVIKVT